MVQEIMHDPLFLAMRSAEAVKEDLPVAKDLTDTLKANADRCGKHDWGKKKNHCF